MLLQMEMCWPSISRVFICLIGKVSPNKFRWRAFDLIGRCWLLALLLPFQLVVSANGQADELRLHAVISSFPGDENAWRTKETLEQFIEIKNQERATKISLSFSLPTATEELIANLRDVNTRIAVDGLIFLGPFGTAVPGMVENQRKQIHSTPFVAAIRGQRRGQNPDLPENAVLVGVPFLSDGVVNDKPFQGLAGSFRRTFFSGLCSAPLLASDEQNETAGRHLGPLSICINRPPDSSDILDKVENFGKMNSNIDDFVAVFSVQILLKHQNFAKNDVSFDSMIESIFGKIDNPWLLDRFVALPGFVVIDADHHISRSLSSAEDENQGIKDIYFSLDNFRDNASTGNICGKDCPEDCKNKCEKKGTKKCCRADGMPSTVSVDDR